MKPDLDDSDYRHLLDFRDGLRRFLRWSAQRAAEAGLTPAQHQLLLAIRGHRAAESPTVGDVADHLLLRHHSVVGLVDRTEAAGLVERRPDPEDHRMVRLRLTPAGTSLLASLTALHVEELDRLRGGAALLWTGLHEGGSLSRRADNPSLLGALPDLGVRTATIVSNVDSGRAER